MKLFTKQNKIIPIPEGFTADSVKTERSICTGETSIGFYDPKTKTLRFSELVRTDADIEAFLKKYGIDTDVISK